MSKRRKIFLAWVIGIFCTPIILFLVLYRLTNFHSQEITKEIQYQLIDLGQHDFIRSTSEMVLGNRRIWVVSGTENKEWFYVSQSDFEKLWPEPWPQMKEKNYTLEVTFIVHPLLLLDGYAIATIKEIKHLQKKPAVIK
jgi:hypothetical protein